VIFTNRNKNEGGTAVSFAKSGDTTAANVVKVGTLLWKATVTMYYSSVYPACRRSYSRNLQEHLPSVIPLV
jgi:hypothetical protein